MKILAVESSAVTVSAALSEDDKIIASEFLNAGLTHSQTLMPMIERVMQKAGVTCGDIDLFAVTGGPGSFTGVRIGVATVKGMAFPDNTPCISISTLEAIAMNMAEESCIAISAMDARRNQIYTAAFDVENGALTRLTPDEAVSVESLVDRINGYCKPVYIVGDGAALAYDLLKEKCSGIKLAAEDNRYQNAENVCRLAFLQRDKANKPEALVPSYLRLSQAERELKLKKEK